MYKLVIFFFLLAGCQNTTGEIVSKKPSYEDISFDVVEKRIFFDNSLPEQMIILINEWFDKKVKVNGIEGLVKIKANKYSKKITDIKEGKKVQIDLEILIEISKPILSQKKYHKIILNEFSTITGNFSLNEVDRIILNTQINLVDRLANKLKSKI